MRHPSDTVHDELRLITRALDQLFGMINHYYPGTYSQKCFCYYLIGLALDKFVGFFREDHLTVLCRHLTGDQGLQEACNFYCWKQLTRHVEEETWKHPTGHLEEDTMKSFDRDDALQRLLKRRSLAPTIYKNVIQKHPDHQHMLPPGIHPFPAVGKTRDLWSEWTDHLQPLEAWWERFTKAGQEVERLHL